VPPEFWARGVCGGVSAGRSKQTIPRNSLAIKPSLTPSQAPPKFWASGVCGGGRV
jgi:hypothetical protein